MDKKELLNDIKSFITNHKENYSGKVLISSVIIKEDHTWKNCLTKIKLINKEEIISPRKNILYDVFALLEVITSIEKLIKIIENIEEGFKIGDFDITCNWQIKYDYQGYKPSNNDYSDFAGNLYFIGGPTILPVMYPTVKYGVPCYKNGLHAIKSWLNLDEFHNYSDARLGKIILFVPNFRARIKNLELKDNKLIITIEGNKKILKELECQIVYSTRGKIYQKNAKFTGKAETSFLIEEEPDEIFVQLVTSEGEKIDFYEDTPYRHSGKERLLKRDINKKVIEKIKNGENEITEFKPFINKGDEKEKEVINTIIAFANCRGGNLIFGVNDNCEVIGIPKKLIKGKSFADFIKEYTGDLRKFVSDRINKKLKLDFKSYEFSNNIILEVFVEEGKNKPYATTPENQIYIRRGANNRMPDPDTELPLLIKK